MRPSTLKTLTSEGAGDEFRLIISSLQCCLTRSILDFMFVSHQTTQHYKYDLYIDGMWYSSRYPKRIANGPSLVDLGVREVDKTNKQWLAEVDVVCRQLIWLDGSAVENSSTSPACKIMWWRWELYLSQTVTIYTLWTIKKVAVHVHIYARTNRFKTLSFIFVLITFSDNTLCDCVIQPWGCHIPMN